MKKVPYLLVLIVASVCSFLLGIYITSEEPSTTKATTSQIKPKNSELSQESKSPVKQKKPKSSSIQADISKVSGSPSEVKQDKTSPDTESYEEALASTVDIDSFNNEVNRVFERFENEPETQSGLNLQSAIKNKMYNSGTYDELLKNNIRFSDATCKLSLCKLEFNYTNKNTINGTEDMTIINALNTKFLNQGKKRNLYSKKEDGKISFFVGRGFLSK